MPTKTSDNAPDASAPAPAPRYRVLSGGITAPIGRPVPMYVKGDIVTAEQLGGVERAQALLSRKAIEVVPDAAD